MIVNVYEYEYMKIILRINTSEIVILAICFQLEQLKLHRYRYNPQFTYMIFIYSFLYIFTVIGHKTNSQWTIYPCGLIAQWIEHCIAIFFSIEKKLRIARFSA